MRFIRVVRGSRARRGLPIYDQKLNFRLRRSIQRMQGQARRGHTRPQSVGYLYEWQG